MLKLQQRPSDALNTSDAWAAAARWPGKICLKLAVRPPSRLLLGNMTIALGKEESAKLHHGHSITAQEENEYDKGDSIITDDASHNVHLTTQARTQGGGGVGVEPPFNFFNVCALEEPPP